MFHVGKFLIFKLLGLFYFSSQLNHFERDNSTPYFRGGGNSSEWRETHPYPRPLPPHFMASKGGGGAEIRNIVGGKGILLGKTLTLGNKEWNHRSQSGETDCESKIYPDRA